jgi:hypothetical protein
MIIIKIDTNNAAFEDNPYEVAEILEKIAKSWREQYYYHATPEKGRDSNGNTVYEVTFEESEQ